MHIQLWKIKDFSAILYAIYSENKLYQTHSAKGIHYECNLSVSARAGK